MVASLKNVLWLADMCRSKYLSLVDKHTSVRFAVDYLLYVGGILFSVFSFFVPFSASVLILSQANCKYSCLSSSACGSAPVPRTLKCRRDIWADDWVKTLNSIQKSTSPNLDAETENVKQLSSCDKFVIFFFLEFFFSFFSMASKHERLNILVSNFNWINFRGHCKGLMAS